MALRTKTYKRRQVARHRIYRTESGPALKNRGFHNVRQAMAKLSFQLKQPESPPAATFPLWFRIALGAFIALVCGFLIVSSLMAGS